MKYATSQRRSRNASAGKRRRQRQCRKPQDSIIVGATHVKNMMRTVRAHTIKNRATAAAVAFASILAVFLCFVGRRDLVACAVCGVFALT